MCTYHRNTKVRVVIGYQGAGALRSLRLRVENDLNTILFIAKAIQEDTGVFPGRINDMVESEMSKQSSIMFTQLPVDPWGQVYNYIYDEDHPRAFTLGSDNSVGGEGEAADVERVLQ